MIDEEIVGSTGELTQKGIDSLYGEDATWRLRPFTNLDKRITIEGPLTLYVDFDDVPTKSTVMKVGGLVDHLNNDVVINAAMLAFDLLNSEVE